GVALLDGSWLTSSGTAVGIAGGTVTWSNGGSSVFQEAGPGMFSMLMQGVTYTAKLDGDTLQWSGDTWVRQPSVDVTTSQG
ncbi:unnamed protein product, partial [Prorocentrum cordatum]